MDCTGCGVALTDATALLTEDGALCAQCQLDIDLQEFAPQEQLRKGTMKYAWGAYYFMFFGIQIDPFSILSTGALLSGLKFFSDFSTKDEDHQKALTRIGFWPKALVLLVILVSLIRIAVLAFFSGT